MSLLPLILTLQMDNASQQFFNKLRKEYFPAERNYLDAHLTLFHNLPNSEPDIEQVLNEMCADTARFYIDVIDIISIGNGVAYKLESKDLQLIHKQLQQEWRQWLIPQDRQKLWPHITIQNKTDAATALKLIDELKPDFKPFRIEALGFSLWEYKGGPWEFVKTFSFKT